MKTSTGNMVIVVVMLFACLAFVVAAPVQTVAQKQGGPRPDQISMALRHYLKLIAETKWRPEMSDAANRARRFATFQCTVSKDLWDDIRNLGGRVDSHTVEAIRLFLL